MNRKIFITLFFSIFTSVTGVGIVVPLLPVYANHLGASGFMVGMIFGSFSLSRILFLPYFGKRSDMLGRKPFITIGLFAYSLVSIAFMFSHGVTQLVVIRFIQGIASAMILPVCQAYIGEIAPQGREGFFMGLFNISMYSSLSLGPILGGVVNDHFGLQTAFACMGVLSLLAFLMAQYFLPPVKEEPRLERGREPVTYRILVKNAGIMGAVLLRTTYTFCIGAIWGFLPVYADAHFNLSSSAIGFLIMLGVLTSGVLTTPMGWLADRVDKRLLCVIGSLMISAAVYSFTFADGFWHLFASNMAFGIGGGIVVPALTAICVIEGHKERAMGSVMALLTIGHSLGMLAGSVAAGVLMDMFSLSAAFTASAVLAILGTLVFIWTSIKDGKQKAG
ncbi:Predicted arabinose efflux permease, MFS family [Desulfatibacillum alkenivorans DSM 16219]|jgi:MFS family permease|uniref:Predicted arabinose efflux permease, MFS family n=1 Tax=Desulfatibacillum alkenivorans DSM 16219 TaxID=1121393 RepID=A0A1M6E6Z0_9BACT|nr:MFS transporter [Desulfatibacillum alkenivorans]SHI81130.1 Predicted arabinose efflux permease, MFS family [Desulfatibacillum alkenivorans DSM 16219]